MKTEWENFLFELKELDKKYPGLEESVLPEVEMTKNFSDKEKQEYIDEWERWKKWQHFLSELEESDKKYPGLKESVLSAIEMTKNFSDKEKQEYIDKKNAEVTEAYAKVDAARAKADAFRTGLA